jgi:hypothetical protein
MRNLRDGVNIYEDDTEVEAFIEKIKGYGLKFPENINKEVSNIIPIVIYDGKFTLFIISWLKCNDNDKETGYLMFEWQNFLTKNKVNINTISEQFKNDPIAMATSIMTQVKDICSRINYPFTVSLAMDGNFLGVIATPRHPLDHITNADGVDN